MFYNVIKDFPDLVVAYAVTKLEKFGSAVSLVAQLELSDHSILHIKDYLFGDGTRKYAYHWQDATGQLRMRWDNSPHHRIITRLPRFRIMPMRFLMLSQRLRHGIYGMCRM